MLSLERLLRYRNDDIAVFRCCKQLWLGFLFFSAVAGVGCVNFVDLLFDLPLRPANDADLRLLRITPDLQGEALRGQRMARVCVVFQILVQRRTNQIRFYANTFEIACTFARFDIFLCLLQCQLVYLIRDVHTDLAGAVIILDLAATAAVHLVARADVAAIVFLFLFVFLEHIESKLLLV